MRMVRAIREWRDRNPHEKGDEYALAEQVYVACEAFAKVTKTAEERAREVVAKWDKLPITAAAPKLEDVIADALRQTERAVWLEAAEVVERQAGYYPEDVFPADGTSAEAISAKALRVCLPAVAAALRRRAEEV